MDGNGRDGEAGLEQVVSSYASDWRTPCSPRDIPQLGDRDLHLVAIDLAGLRERDLGTVLDRQDLRRGQRIRDGAKRRLYLGGRYGLKRLLSAYTGVDNDDLEFGYGARGKPRLLSATKDGSIEFNYTLSGDKALYGFCRRRELGVDMELLPRKINASRMAATRLTAGERQAWASLPEGLQNDGMLCCWTRKEAYGKAIGVGIRFRLGAVNLFTGLDYADWWTPLSGLFDTTMPTAMPGRLWGVQLSMPFDAVAAVMVAGDAAAERASDAAGCDVQAPASGIASVDRPSPPLTLTTFFMNASCLTN